MNKNKTILIIGLIIFITILSGTAYFYFSKYQTNQNDTNNDPITRNPCLEDDEYVDYEIEKNPAGGGIAKIFIKDKETNQEKFSFQIKISNSDHYHPVEIHGCGVYVIRTFGYDYQKKAPLENYKRELWRYKYDGTGNSLISDSAKWSYENILGDFRVSPDEKYLVLEKSYLGKADYALVIKNLETKKDVFVLTLSEILKQYLDIQPGSFALGVWTPDNKYLWGVLYDGPFDTAYYRIELGTWKTDILASPDNIPSGAERDFNFKGWLAYADITSFTGIDEMTKQIEEEARKEGKMKNLWIYNLFTKEKIKIASAGPSWRFNLEWLSDTELQYELPNGEKKVYKINE